MEMNDYLKKIIKEVLSEATVEKDYYYYNLAEDFYNKMIKELERENYIQKTDDIIFFKGYVVNKDYDNLLIIFTDTTNKKVNPIINGVKKSVYGFGSYNNYKAIVIPNIINGNLQLNRINKDNFIHEFIHYLDFKRSGGYRPNKPGNNLDLNDYYNQPTEFNAYYQEAANFIVKTFNDNKKIVDNFREKYKNYDNFYKWMIDNVFDKEFIKYLNSKNQIKLKKRIYNIYSKYIK
jgi:hypothetical protein